MKELNIPTNVAIINIASGTRYVNSRIYGMINKPFSEVRACVAKEYEKGVLKGIAFGKTIKIEGIADGKIIDIHSFTNSIIEAIETAEQTANDEFIKLYTTYPLKDIIRAISVNVLKKLFAKQILKNQI